jgi:Tfp pilus assembly protein PilF
METPRSGLLVASLICYCAALMSKETAVVLPVIVFVYVLTGIPGAKNTSAAKPGSVKAALRETLPFVAVTAFYFGLRLAVLHSFRAGSSPWLSRSAVLLTAPSVFLFYLRHLIWPGGLRLFYDFAPVPSVRSSEFWVPLIVLAALAGCALLGWRRLGTSVLAATAWIVLPLLPVLNIGIFFKDDFLHDRYLYLPSIGLALLVGLATRAIFGQKSGPALRIGALTGFVLLLFFLGASTVIQAAPWQDNLSLYSHSAEHSTNTMARVNLASELSKRGQYEQAKTILEGVILERPDFWLANYDLGYVSYRLKDLSAAERLLRRAIALDPGDADAREYLGLTLFRENRADEAATLLSEAIARNSVGQGYHLALGIALRQQGHQDAAKAEFAQEIRNHPENPLIRSEVAQLEDSSASQR